MTGNRAQAAAPDEDAVLEAVRRLASELRGGAPVPPVRLDTRLDAELGLDSLSLVELRGRLESEFDAELPDRVLSVAVTPAEWVEALRLAHGRVSATPVRRRPATVAEEVGGGVPVHAGTLTEVLQWHADADPGRAHVRILHTDEGDGPDASAGRSGEEPEQVLTYRDLHRSSLAVAGGLGELGVGRGESVAIMLPTGRAYFEAFMGILLAGAVPIPIYPPARPAAIEDHLRRQARILENAEATVLVADSETLRAARILRPHVPTLRAVQTVAELGRGPATRTPVVGGTERTALVQYTSGSTGNPKGVVLTHGQILANIRAMGGAARVTSSDVFVSWLPLYHDMGLIGAWMASLYFGYPLVLMGPLAFLARPARWLRAVSAYGGTLSVAPNFGYELCLRHITDAELDGVDLSTWRMALNGAEPVSPETVRRFVERFAPYGFRPETMAPVYGLAEVGVGLCFPPLGRAPLVDAVDRAAFSDSGRASPSDDPGAVRFVACGRPLPGYQVRVVDASGREVDERQEGRIECSGPSVTSGYRRDPQASKAVRHGEWLETGDLGYLADGDLYVTGREKDIVIKAGRNLHPEELEEAVGAIPGIRKGCVAVFASTDPVFATERLVVLAETHRTEPGGLEELRAAITSTTLDLLGTPPDDVVLAPPGTVLKTSSGKIRRAASRQRYEAGDVGRRARAPWWQVTRFVWSGLRASARATGRVASSWLYAVYAWSVVAAVGVPTWVLVELVPTVRLRWRVVRGAGHLVARLVGVSFTVSGETFPAGGARVLVANHPSFVDGLVVALSVTEPLTFVAGGELATQRVAGPFLRRLGCAFVDRDDPERMVADVTALTDAAAAGRVLVFFPEGGLAPAPGLRTFHLGAFTVATATGASVVPIGIRGSRGIVRPGEKFPRRGAVEVVFGAPIEPEGSGWEATLRLRDRARRAVLALSGEPDEP